MTPDIFEAVLAARTPGRWHWHAYGHRSIRSAAGAVTQSLFKGTGTDLYYVHDDDEGPHIALTGNGPKSYDNAVVIATQANLAPLLLDLWRAADDVWRPIDDR